MGTCAVVGEAAGVAAALAEQRGVTARDLATTQMDQVHRALVRSDASVLGVRNTDPADLALSASVRSSSTLRELAVEASAGTLPLDSHVGMVLPVDPAMAGLGLLVDAADATELVVELYSTGRPQNYLPAMCEKIITVSVPEGPRQWVPVPLDWSPGSSQNAFVVMRANPAVALHHSESTRPGTLFFRHREPPADELYPEQWRYWKQILHRRSICYRLDQPTEAFAASHVRGGYARPYGGPQMWVSDSLEVDDQPWVELSWKDPVSFREVALIFDDNVEEDLINLHHHRTPFDVMPGLVRDYRVEAAKDGAWSVLACVRANRWRHRVHRMADTVTASRLRVVVMSTNGARQAHVVAVRAYADSVEPSPADA